MKLTEEDREKIRAAKENAWKKMMQWLDGSKNPGEYDFRELIVEFKEDDEIYRYITYQAIGLWEGENLSEAEWKYKEYKKGKDRILIPKEEADSCPVMQEIYKKLWKRKYLEYCEYCLKDDEKRATGDTMNSCNTTLNHLIKILAQRGDFDLKPGIRIYPYWSKKKTIIQYKHDLDSKEGTTKNLMNALKNYKYHAELENFLGAAYKIGNFLPVPTVWNGPRGTGPTQDFWDLALKCIYDWYNPSSSSDKKQSFLAKLLNYNEIAMKDYINCLNFFGTWDGFVKGNYLQHYTQGYTKNQEQDFGPPIEFWAGHFDGAPLPVTDEQFRDFFVKATRCITNRSNQMVIALREKLQKEKF